MDITSPLIVGLVDGVAFHGILELIGLPLLRLSTDGQQEETKIIKHLSDAMGSYERYINPTISGTAIQGFKK